MLNGKFYTGLPPKMMDRNMGSQNRLESHLFWPDDTRVESAHETRIRRRASFHSDTPKDTNYQRQTSWNGNDSGIDTRQRFQKEFAKSSIQFFDNIQEEEVDNRSRQQGLRKKSLKQDIAIKPTAIKMELPNNDTRQEEYAAIKKSQAFSSKIQFYDYADDSEKQNNKLKPKMDRNDKKAVERNTKNSPKLQVKGIVRNLRLGVDEQRNNDRNYEDDYERPKPETRIIRNEMREELRGEPRRSNLRYENPNKRYSHNNNDQYNDYDYDYDRPQFSERRVLPRAQSVPKRILKYSQSNQSERDFEDYNDNVHNDLDYVENNTRNMRIRNSPKKHVTYGDEVYEYETQSNRNDRNDENDDNDDHINFREHRTESRTNVRMSNGNAGTAYGSSATETKSLNRPSAGNKQRQPFKRSNLRDFDDYMLNTAGDDQEQQLRYETNTASKKTFNTFNNNKSNNNNNKNNNNNRNTKHNNQTTKPREQENKISPKMSAATKLETGNTDSPTSSTLQNSPTTDAQKHLRSNLCFHDGEIVAKSRETPTSEPGSRRTARSAATSRRICVGLPD